MAHGIDPLDLFDPNEFGIEAVRIFSIKTMNRDLVPIPRRELGKAGLGALPVIVARAGERAAWRFVEFFTATIRNRNTRAAFARAVKEVLCLACEATSRPVTLM